MSDADDTKPNRVLPNVTILLEITVLDARMPRTAAQEDVYLSRGDAEVEALRRYDHGSPALEDRLLLDDIERRANRERWHRRLLAGQPVHLEANRTIRMRTLVVR